MDHVEKELKRIFTHYSSLGNSSSLAVMKAGGFKRLLRDAGLTRSPLEAETFYTPLSLSKVDLILASATREGSFAEKSTLSRISSSTCLSAEKSPRASFSLGISQSNFEQALKQVASNVYLQTDSPIAYLTLLKEKILPLSCMDQNGNQNNVSAHLSFLDRPEVIRILTDLHSEICHFYFQYADPISKRMNFD